MKRRNFILSSGLMCCNPFPAFAHKKTNVPYSEMILDLHTGSIIHQNNIEMLIQPASLTKIMSLYLIFDALDEKSISMDTIVSMTHDAAKKPPTKLGLRVGDKINVANAICAMTVHSCNDITAMMADFISGNEHNFVKQMNRKAKELNLQKTKFTNASGLPESINISTAYDLALLSTTLMAKHHNYIKAFSLPAWEWDGKIYHNSNHLMGKYPGMDFCKTGYISESGFNLIASASQNKKRFLAIIIGAPNQNFRNERMKQLLNWAFDA